MGESVQQPESEVGMLAFPEQLSIKANRLRDEFERLRSADSDEDEDEDADGEDEDEDAAPPIQEMSSADRRKIFVETRRLVFAPIDYSDVTECVETKRVQQQQEEDKDQEDDHSVTPWHPNPLISPVTNIHG